MLLALLAACDQAPKPKSMANAAESYPDFEQASATGDAAQLWFKPADIAFGNGRYLLHALRTLPEGYAIFEVVTDCEGAYLRLAGTQYRSDGTIEHNYPGTGGPVAVNSEPGMSVLLERACAVAAAARSIPGEFNAPAALGLLFGPYDPRAKSALWQDASIPPQLRKDLSLQAGQAVRVSSAAIFDFSEQGKQKKVLVTNAVADDQDCHACPGALGIAIFVNYGSRWQVESSEPYVALGGENASFGDKFDWVAAGDDLYALVVHRKGMPQGIWTVSADVFLRAQGKFTLAISDSAEAEFDSEGLEAAAAFQKSANTGHYDAMISFSYTMPGQPGYIEHHLYQYSGDRYTLVQKDAPPKFAQPAAEPTGEPAGPPSSPTQQRPDSGI